MECVSMRLIKQKWNFGLCRERDTLGKCLLSKHRVDQSYFSKIWLRRKNIWKHFESCVPLLQWAILSMFPFCNTTLSDKKTSAESILMQVFRPDRRPEVTFYRSFQLWWMTPKRSYQYYNQIMKIYQFIWNDWRNISGVRLKCHILFTIRFIVEFSTLGFQETLYNARRVNHRVLRCGNPF